jgi:hypothetical protein
VKARKARQWLLRRGLFAGYLAMACCVAAFVISLFGEPYPWQAVADTVSVLNLQGRAKQAAERWGSSGVRAYQIKATYRAGHIVCGPTRLTVRDGQIVEQTPPGDTHWFPPEACDRLAAAMTVEGAFKAIQADMLDYVPYREYLRVSFDETFGYPTRVEAGDYRAPDELCCSSLTLTDLQPLE